MRKRTYYADKARRERRTVCIFVAIIIILSAYLSIGAIAENTEKYTVVVVDAGDTLWQLCEENKPDNVDLRNYMYKVKYVNNMKSSALNIGQEIIFPNS